MIWKARVTEEFRNRLGPDFGVYVIRDKEKRVLYIGKGGTGKLVTKRFLDGLKMFEARIGLLTRTYHPSSGWRGLWKNMVL
jgi:hypothetical protein